MTGCQMAEVLLINPRRRRKAKKAKARRVRSTAKRASYKRKRNPLSMRKVRRVNPIRKMGRRRRNPIKLGGLFSGVVPMVKDAVVGAAGSVAIDFAHAKVNPMLPAMLQTAPGKVGAGDAVKAVMTVAIGKLLSRFTRGMSVKAAQGALTVQMDRIVRTVLPTTISAQLSAYNVPAAVVMGTNRIGPNRMATGFNAYARPGGATPLLSAYARPGSPTPLLSSARRLSREAAATFRR